MKKKIIPILFVLAVTFSSFSQEVVSNFVVVKTISLPSAYQQNLRFVDETPEYIVVGIKTKDNERSKLYNSESTRLKTRLAEAKKLFEKE